MANRRFIDFPIASSVGENDIILIWQSGANKQTTKGTLLSGIATELENLTDVQITSLANGQILEYDSVIGKWKNVAKSDTDLSDLGDVSIISPVTGQVLVYNATTDNWENSSAGLVPYVGAVTTVNLGNQQLIAGKTTITSNGGDDTLIVNHTSGSGIALDIAKAGNGEGLRVAKSSGSGNAVTITGGLLSAEAATFSGVVTTTPDAVINALNVGRGGGNLTSNTRLGVNSLNANTTGNQNTAVGTQVLLNNTTASFNTGIGFNALLRNTTGSGNTAVGAQALVENTTGPQNTAVGVFALQLNTTASANTAIGWSSLYSNTTGTNNTGLGSQSLHQNTTGINNTAAGRIALRDNTTGSQNSAFGNLALYFNTTGSQNTGIGYSALGGITTGINNVAVGHIAGNLINSGTDNATSNNSVYIGQDTRASASGNTNEIVIGSAGRGNGSNTVTLGNDSITSTFLKGNISLKGENSAVKSIQYTNPSGTIHWSAQTSFGAAGEHQPFSIRNGVLGTDAIVIQPASNNITFNNSITNFLGSLSGTGCFFSSDIQTGTRLIAANPSGEIRITPNLSGTTNRIESFGSLPFSLTSVGAITLAAGGTTPQITLATDGAVTLTGALNGTSASFTGDLTLQGSVTRNLKFLDSTNTNLNAQIQYDQISSNSGQLLFGTNNAGTFSTKLTIANTGAATFSSSVTVNADATINSLTVGRGAGNISTNAAFGDDALNANTTGLSNVAVGHNALTANITGSANTAVGRQALFNNTTANSNTAVGRSALQQNTTGAENTAVGGNALLNNTTASNNTAVGLNALNANTTGAENTALGRAALFDNTTGGSNTAVGLESLENNTTGGNNTSVGQRSLANNTTGLNNTALGGSAGRGLTTGSNNLLLGVNAGRATSPSGNITTQSNRICLGDSNITNAHVQVAWTIGSDARDKTNISEVPHGLDFVSQLQPISYQFKKSRNSDIAIGDTHYGFKAQDVLQLEGDNPVIVNNKNEDKLGFKESNLIPILVNAIKELQAEIEILKSK